ncbi:hypothetical protein ONZ45_g6327 [Pleurotus djamor]|nr:hypothetical protein ONZ45_g6327 [Pleurotus djamor]
MSSHDADPGNPTTQNEREVTDPITHLPVAIHDFTEIELEKIPPPNSQPDQPPSNLLPNQQTDGKRTALERSDSERDRANRERHTTLDEMLIRETTLGRWVDPRDTKSRMTVHTAIVASVAAFCAAFASVSSSYLWHGRESSKSVELSWLGSVLHAFSSTLGLLLEILICAILSGFIVSAYVYAVSRMPDQIPVPSSESIQTEGEAGLPQGHEQSEDPPQIDQTTWLNAVLVTLWPIINPTLFTPLADIIEDSLQASLPHFVKAVKIADIGQGIEPVRIQQVQWLDAPRKQDSGNRSEAQSAEEEEESGEFVCLELGLVYRSALPPSSKLHAASIGNRSTNPHMVLHLWTVAGIQIPFYISLHSLLCNLRVRIALTPNPPFSSLATVSLLGLPHVSFSLTPLSRHLPNVMDVPILSNWVKQSIDSAMDMYVAPRSVSLDLGLMLAGGERIDTEGVGIVAVRVISAEGFRAGDRMKAWKNVIPGVHVEDRVCQGDAYVTAGWGKWGKPLWSSRIVNDEMIPVWDEYTFLVVSPAELDSHERLRLQLWDADRMTADDNLGNVHVDLKELMSSEETLKKMSHREDDLTDIDGTTQCPGTLKWEVGYFPKVTLGSWLLEMYQTNRRHWQSTETNAEHGSDEERDNVSDIEHSVMDAERDAESAVARDTEPKSTNDSETRPFEDDSTIQEKLEDEVAHHEKELGTKAADIVSGTPPSDHWPSGILAVRIEQIEGLEIEKIRASGDQAIQMEHEEEDDGDGTPSAYCVVIINHQRVFKTRTKMVSGKPYFDAGLERFIKDWHTTSVMISVRDSRLHEVDPIIGVVDLPLYKLFSKRSHITDSFPLAGGIGYGRVKLSLSFRSVELQLPHELQGWDVGTLEVHEVRLSQTGPIAGKTRAFIDELKKCRLISRTSYAKRKLVGTFDEERQEMVMRAKHSRTAKLAVRQRYASCLVLEFRKRVLGPDPTPAFGILWLKDIPDEEEVELTIPLQHNSNKSLERAQKTASHGVGETVNGAKLQVKLRFWRGLSGYHKKLAKNEKGVADVMEVLDCVEEYHGHGMDLETATLSESGSGTGSSSSERDDDADPLESGKVGGVVTQIKDFHKRKGQLHRKHRGLMQWSGTRKMKWVVRKAEDKVTKAGVKTKEKVIGRKHSKKELDMETEV